MRALRRLLRRHPALQAVARYVRLHPFSLLLTAVIVPASIVFSLPRTHATRWLAAGPITTGHEHLWWTPLTALLVPESLLEAILTAAVILTVMTYIERVIGTTRTVLAYFGVGVVAILVGIGAHLLTIWLGTPLLLLARPDITLDPAIGVAGVLMAGSAFAPTLFRRRIRIIGFAVVLMFALYAGDQDSTYRVIAAVIGLALGALLHRGAPGARPTRGRAPATQPPGRQWRRMSYAEVRTLMAAVVAVTGIGPIVVLLDRTVSGPLALVVSGYAQIDRGAAFGRCAGYFHSSCHPHLLHGVAQGLSAVLLSLVPVVFSLIAAWGLRSGRRAAWILAIVVNAADLVATGAALGVLSLLSPVAVERVGERFALAAVLAVGVPLAVIVALVLTRHRFPVRARARATRAFALVAGVAFAFVVVVWALLMLTTGTADVPLGFREMFGRLLSLFLPAGFLRALGPTVDDPDGLLALVNSWVGLVFWAAVAAGVVVLLRSADHRSASDGIRFRTLLTEIGGGTLGFLGTWAGTQHWIAPDGGAAVAYRRIGHVALAVSDPVCRPGDEHETLDGFIRFCDQRGWDPVFYSIHAGTARVLRDRGWRSVSVGEETVVHVAGLELTGGLWKRVRQALAKAERARLQAIWTRWDDLPPALSAQIEVLSEQWVADKALPELGFTLGGLEELRDPDVALLLAVDDEGALQAVTSWLPSWRDGRLVGWTLDFMRRSDEAIAEVMVYLIATAALRMRDSGIEVMSLSGAPLATRPVPPGEQPPPTSMLSRILQWLADVLEPVYGFRSLFEFKRKFHPELDTLYMAYADAVSLPAAGRAIMRAYLPQASPRESLRLVRTVGARMRDDADG